MAKFQYATKDNKLKTIEAANSQEAIQLVRGLTDAAKGSGVIAVVDNPAANVVTKGGAVDVSQIPASDVKPFAETYSEDRVMDTVDDQGNKTQVTLYEKDGKTYQRNPDGSSTVVRTMPSGIQDVTFEDQTPEGKLSRQADTIRSEITEIETRMAGRSGERTEMLDDADVFDDLRRLNGLKDELRTAQDRSLEIPIESRQRLRGNQATKTEFAADTRPELENAALRELAASRATSRLTDTINTNIAVVDAFIEAETAKDEFLYEQKIKRLDKVEAIYGNIITEKQKAALEERKFEQQLILENVKLNNTVRGDLIKSIASMGIGGSELSGLMTASVDDLINYKNSVSGPTNWSNMSFEQAAQTLSPEQFTRYQAYIEYKKTAGEEEDAFLAEGLSQQQSAIGIIDTVDKMLNNVEGLQTSVGSLPFGNTVLGDKAFNFLRGGAVGAAFATDEANAFRADARQLTSQATLQQLKDLKAAGATLGAISEKELQILADAALALGTVYDGSGNSTGRFNLSEKDFQTALETVRLASMKTFIAASIGKGAYAQSGLINADYDTVNKLYTELKVNGSKPQTNFYEEDRNPVQLDAAFNVLMEEEGLRTSAYQDQTGKWTIGYGNTTIGGRAVQPGDKITTEQATALMQTKVLSEYTTFADRVSSPVTPNQFAALTSFEYNLGPGVWNSDTGQRILSLVDSGNFGAAGSLMLAYNKSRNPATGQLEPNPVLAQRRAREANLLLT